MNPKLMVFAAALLLASTMPARSEAATECRFNFGSSAFAWCVSATGNIMRLTSPTGAEHIRVGTFLEGYVLCASGVAPYYDLGAVAAGWEPTRLVTGPTTTRVALARTTADGRFTLTQDVVGDVASRSLTITMRVTNNVGTMNGVRLLRTVDLDIDGTFRSDVFDKSSRTLWARQIRAVTLSSLTPEVFNEVRISATTAPRTCTPTSYTLIPSVNADLAGSVRHDLGTLAAGGSRSVRVRYRVE